MTAAALPSASVTTLGKTITFRADIDDYDWLVRRAERMRAELGVSVSMADVLRKLIRDARAAEEQRTKRRR